MTNGANVKKDWVKEVGEKKMAAVLIVQVEHVSRLISLSPVKVILVNYLG